MLSVWWFQDKNSVVRNNERGKQLKNKLTKWFIYWISVYLWNLMLKRNTTRTGCQGKPNMMQTLTKVSISGNIPIILFNCQTILETHFPIFFSLHFSFYILQVSISSPFILFYCQKFSKSFTFFWTSNFSSAI